MDLLNEITEQPLPSLEMDASEVGASHGETTIDYVWSKRLESALQNTEPAANLKAALLPLAFFDEIVMEELMAAVEGRSEEWKDWLHNPASGFNLPPTYPLDFAVAIYLYTLSDPALHVILNRELWNPARRVPGASGAAGISPRLRACLPFIRFLIDACKALPPEYMYRGEVRRGVKWTYPSPDQHDPKGHFVAGKPVRWFEFKSTTKSQEVMTREHFLGVNAGPRTIFTIEVCDAWDIAKFSFFQGQRSEAEVLILPLATFLVVMAQKNIINPKETESLQKSGFPDAVFLRQIIVEDAGKAQREKEEQERKDAELAKQLQQQLWVEEEAKKAADKKVRMAKIVLSPVYIYIYVCIIPGVYVFCIC